jgi:hypothetical protein
LDLASLLTEYLAIVRPVEIWFCEYFNLKGKDDLKEFLWADYKRGVWDGDDLSNLLKTFTVLHGMRPLGLQEYRQVAIAYMEKHLRYKVDDGDHDEGGNIFNLQAGHGDRMTNISYAVATGDSRIITRESMHLFYLASEAWQKLLRESDKKTVGINLMRTIINLIGDTMRVQNIPMDPISEDLENVNDLIEISSPLIRRTDTIVVSAKDGISI